MGSRVGLFLRRIILSMIILTAIAAVIYVLQEFYGILDPLIVLVNKDVSKINDTLARQMLTGISIGTIVLVLVMLLFPVFMKGVDNKQYFQSVQRGLISSLVFLITDVFYNYMERISRFYMLVSIVSVMAVTFILIEILSLSIRKDQEVEFRTEMVASVVSGLIFGMLLKLLQFGWDYFKVWVL